MVLSSMCCLDNSGRPLNSLVWWVLLLCPLYRKRAQRGEAAHPWSHSSRRHSWGSPAAAWLLSLSSVAQEAPRARPSGSQSILTRVPRAQSRGPCREMQL